MINGVRVRDSGVELSPTGTDCREARERASNRAVRASSAIAAGSTRWLMRRTKRPLSAKVACYFIVNFRIPPNFSSILKPTALQILVRRRKQSCSTASLIFGYFWSGAAQASFAQRIWGDSEVDVEVAGDLESCRWL